jgi:glycolate oxidase iron-sulfur subunit
MSAVAQGAAEVDGEFADIMGFCLQCRACEPVCPGMVRFGRAMEGARAEVAAQVPDPGRDRRHRLLRRLLTERSWRRSLSTGAALAQRLRLAGLLPGTLRKGMSGLRRLPIRSPGIIGGAWDPEGSARGTAALLAGCVMEPWFDPVHRALIGLLNRGGYRVVVPAGQTCCGALAAHDGDPALAGELAAANVAAFDSYDLIVADAAGCSAHLKGYEHWAEGGERVASRARDAVEVVAALIDEGLLPRHPPTGELVAVQDPCHLRHAQRIVEAPRKIVAAAGYEVVDLDEGGFCCGAAGLYSVLQPEASAELGRAKAKQVSRSGARIVASANPGCEMQLRSHVPESVTIAHPVELYAGALAAGDSGR